MFVENGKFDHQALYTTNVTRNLNKVIDRNYYPVKKQRTLASQTNWSRVQGLADAFIMLRLPLQVTS
jgi:hypothetical protein